MASQYQKKPWCSPRTLPRCCLRLARRQQLQQKQDTMTMTTAAMIITMITPMITPTDLLQGKGEREPFQFRATQKLQPVPLTKHYKPK